MFQYFIPKSCSLVKSTLLREAHRDTFHGGPHQMVAALGDWYLQGAYSSAVHLRRHCIPCQIATATRSWSNPPSFNTDIADLATK